MNAYLAGLIVIAGSVALLRRGPVSRCATVLILNWLAGYEFNELFGTYTPWLWSTLIDAAGAGIILYRPRGRWQAALATSYGLQIACHFIFALGAWSPRSYWEVLTAIAWVQLLIVGTWGGRIAERVSGRPFRDDFEQPMAGHLYGMDQSR